MLIGRRHCMLSRKKWHNDQQSDKVLPDNCSYPIRCELLLAHCWLITRHQPPTSNHPDRIRPMVVLYKWWFCTAVTVQSHVAALAQHAHTAYTAQYNVVSELNAAQEATVSTVVQDTTTKARPCHHPITKQRALINPTWQLTAL